MKKRFAFILAGILFLAISVLMPSCKEEIYTDEEALAAMKEGLKYKNDLQKELATLALTNELQILNLQSQLSIEEMLVADSLSRVGAKTIVSVQVYDITGNTDDMSGFSVSVNQNGVLKTLTTPASGLVVFPDFITGSAAIVVSKTGYARASGIMNIEGAYYDLQTTQEAVLVPVFPTETSTATLSGVLTAQLDLTTEAKEPVKDGVVTINFADISDILDEINGDLKPTYGLIGIVYDGGFMQAVKTGADGKYSFNVPKTKLEIQYKLGVATIQKKQKLLYGDYPNLLDSMRLDSLNTFFGYYANSSSPVQDEVYLGYYYDYGTWASFPGVNLKIDAPVGGNKPTAAATINWAHNDSTLVTWSFSKFNFGNGSTEFTKITQNPVFSYSPTDKTKVQVVTPAAAVINIVNGKVISLNMTNGGTYKEYGRFWPGSYTVAPTQANGTTFKFFEQLAAEEVHGLVKGDTLYQTAIATASVILDAGKVKIAFDMKAPGGQRPGVGYTAIPNVEFHLKTPVTADSTLTQANLKVNLLTGGGLSIDTLVLSKYTSTTGFGIVLDPQFSTFLENGVFWAYTSAPYSVTATPSNTYKVELLNGWKIADGGLGYSVAPKVRVENYARKQGTTGSYVFQTIAEAATTIDADGRIIAVADPVMTDNLNIQYNTGSVPYLLSNTHTISVPADIPGKTQAYARAMVDMYGTITNVLLWNEDQSNSFWNGHETVYSNWWSSDYFGSGYFSGKGYLSAPKITVTPVGLTTVEKPAVLKAVVNSSGRINNIIIVDGGKGYTVKNDPKALITPDYLVRWIFTNGASDVVYNIDMGSGWHGNPIEIFNND